MSKKLDHRVVDTETGEWVCHKCGDRFDINSKLPLPVDMAIALMGSWNDMHKHNYIEECPKGQKHFAVSYHGRHYLYATDEKEAFLETERELNKKGISFILNECREVKNESGSR